MKQKNDTDMTKRIEQAHRPANTQSEIRGENLSRRISKQPIECGPPDDDSGCEAEDQGSSEGSNSAQWPPSVDISWLANQVGISRTVTLSPYAWETCVAVPKGVSWLSEFDRLWELLMELRSALAERHPFEEEFLFDVRVQQSATENNDVRLEVRLSSDSACIYVWD
jgi:hypothetical protein